LILYRQRAEGRGQRAEGRGQDYAFVDPKNKEFRFPNVI
jgi:hypothetical protein